MLVGSQILHLHFSVEDAGQVLAADLFLPWLPKLSLKGQAM